MVQISQHTYKNDQYRNVHTFLLISYIKIVFCTVSTADKIDNYSLGGFLINTVSSINKTFPIRPDF